MRKSTSAARAESRRRTTSAARKSVSASAAIAQSGRLPTPSSHLEKIPNPKRAISREEGVLKEAGEGDERGGAPRVRSPQGGGRAVREGLERFGMPSRPGPRLASRRHGGDQSLSMLQIRASNHRKVFDFDGRRRRARTVGRTAVDGFPNGFPIVRLVLSRTAAETPEQGCRSTISCSRGRLRR